MEREVDREVSRGRPLNLLKIPSYKKKSNKKKLNKWTPHKHKSRKSSTITLLLYKKKTSMRSDYNFRGVFLFSAVNSINW